MGIHFHSNKDLYFKMQRENAAAYVIPFIREVYDLKENTHVLEIGCAEGGVLKAFLDAGCTGVGVELSEARAQRAEGYLEEEIKANRARIISKNIYDPSFLEEFKGKFDIIVLKDVIEHIHDQEKLMGYMKTFLRPGGGIFFGFPPWTMPFGGHQQICKSKIGKMPWYHILPRPVYRGMLKMFGEKEATINELMDIYTTRISLERFEKISKKTGYRVMNKLLYLVNPIYKYKFGWKPRKQSGVIGAIPWFRNFVTTCGYYFLVPGQSQA